MDIIKELNGRRPITQIVDKKLIEDNDAEKDRHAPGKLYPSSVHKCSRAICYEMLGYDKPQFTATLLKVFANGNSVHDRYQKLFNELGITVSDEVPIVEESLRISGRMDAVLDISSIAGKPLFAVGELKSARDSAFQKMKDANKPDEKYVAQLQLYLHLSGIDIGVIYVENKNDQDVLEFWIGYDKEYCTKLIKKIKSVVETVDKKNVLSKEEAEKLDIFMVDPKKMYNGKYSRACYYCRYCDYKTECYK